MTKKLLAALAALCLALAAISGALAIDDDALSSTLQSFLSGNATETPAAEPQPEAEPEPETEAEPVAEAQPEPEVESQPEAEPQPEIEAQPEAEAPAAEPNPDIDENYVFEGGEEEEIVVDELIEVDDFAVTPGLSEDWLNILLLGTDDRGANKYSRTDTMIILSINSKTGEAKLTSIMRDTWVSLPGHGDVKLNAACVYGGPRLTIRTVNEYFHMNIEHYALVNMRCLVAIVDELGGIRMDITEDERRAMNALITSDANADDENHDFGTALISESGSDVLLNGKQALAYARIRKSDSDYARTERQRKVLLTIAKRLQQEGPLGIMAILANLMEYVETNLEFDQIATLAVVALRMDAENVTQLRLPAEGTYTSGMVGDTWCIQPDFEQNAALLHAFIYGE